MTEDYLVRVIAALDRLTEFADEVEDGLTRRLIGRADSDDSASPGPAGGTGRLRQLGRMFVLLPKLAVQHRKLARVDPGTRPSAVVVGIASNRLTLNERATTARDGLIDLFARIGGAPDAGIAESIRQADHVLLFDAVPISTLWTQSDRCIDNNVFIIDGAFVLFEMIVSAVLGGRAPDLWRVARRAAAALNKQGRSRTPRLRRAMLAAAIAETIARILGRWTAISAYFLTCHSILTELLRAQLIESPSCRRIVDVMHGVGSIPAEELFATVLEAGRPYGAYTKHHFIPQIPGIPLAGVFKSQATTDTSCAINAYLNMYFLRFENEGRDVASLLDAEHQAIRARHANGTDPVIITVLGYAPHNGRLMGSAAFDIECALLSFMGELRDATGANWMLTYAPHPIHAALPFDLPLFERYNISVYRNSVLTWLISDMCVSLMSSAMFEAAHFGVRAFTPMITADRVFTADYLDLVSHPAGASLDDCKEALRAFLTEYAPPPGTDVLQRAKHRLALMRRSRSQDNDPRSGVNEQDWPGQGHRVLVG